MLNRCAIVVVPMEPFIEWLKSQSEWVDADDPYRHESSVYLLPDSVCDEVGYKEWEEAGIPALFQAQLEKWVPDRRGWPELTVEKFDEWFCIDCVNDVHDFGGELMLDCDPGDEVPF